jgi:hypothetical protein
MQVLVNDDLVSVHDYAVLAQVLKVFSGLCLMSAVWRRSFDSQNVISPQL